MNQRFLLNHLIKMLRNRRLEKPVKFFYQKRSIATSTHCIFLSFYKVFILQHLEYATRASSPFLSWDSKELESVQKTCDEVCKRTATRPIRGSPPAVAALFPVRRRIRGDLICIYNIMNSHLDYQIDVVFAAPTRAGLRSQTFKIHQQLRKTCNKLGHLR